MVNPNEVFELLLALVFAPVIVSSLRGAFRPARQWTFAGLLALLLSYVFTIVEGFGDLFDTFNTLEHGALAIAGACFAAAAVLGFRHWHVRGGDIQ